MKKLKQIPADLVSYIQIETEAIEDFTDKRMISSYCISKLETVNWHLELLGKIKGELLHQIPSIGKLEDTAKKRIIHQARAFD